MPLTKFYPCKSNKGRFVYFMRNNEVFFTSITGRVAKSAISLEAFKEQYTEPFIEAETSKEALDMLRLLRD